MRRFSKKERTRTAPPFGGASITGWIWRLRQSAVVRSVFLAYRRWRRGVRAMAAPGGRVTILHAPSNRATPLGQDLVVLTANLWHDWPLRRRLPERMEAFARMIEAEGVDVVLTQEVARTSDQWFDRWLSDRLGMSCHYSTTNGHHGAMGFEEGLAIFARYPIASSRVRRFSPTISRFINRQALGAEIETPFGNLWVFSVHLSLLRSHNAMQVAALHDWVSNIAGDQSAVVGGDFNVPEHAPQIQYTGQSWLDTFRHMHPLADAATYEVRSPWGASISRNRLDYLFLRENEPTWQVVEARHVRNPHSDHKPALVRLSRANLIGHP